MLIPSILYLYSVIVIVLCGVEVIRTDCSLMMMPFTCDRLTF